MLLFLGSFWSVVNRPAFFSFFSGVPRWRFSDRATVTQLVAFTALDRGELNIQDLRGFRKSNSARSAPARHFISPRQSTATRTRSTCSSEKVHVVRLRLSGNPSSLLSQA